MENKLGAGIPLESYSIKIGDVADLDSAIASFEKHIIEILKEELGKDVEIRIHVIGDRHNVTLLPILVES